MTSSISNNKTKPQKIQRKRKIKNPFIKKILDNSIFQIIRKSLSILSSLLILLIGLDLLKYAISGAFSPDYFLKFLGSPTKSFFLSYLMTEITMSGSPIAGAFIGLGETLKIPAQNLMAIIMGTRGGVNSILLITGLLMLFKGKSLKRSLGITVLQFLVTFSVTLLSAAFVFSIIKLDIIEQISTTLSGHKVGGFGISTIVEFITDGIKYLIPNMTSTLIFGIVCMILGLFLFDKCFSFVKDKKVVNKIHKIKSKKNAFISGLVITALTMSLSVSVTLLLPLYVRKILTRRHLVPYILGANITTLLDTLFLSLLTNSLVGTKVIITFILATIISVSIYLFIFTYYKSSISYLTDKVLEKKSYFIIFLIIIMLSPLIIFVI